MTSRKPRHQHIASSTFSDLEPESDTHYLSSSPPPTTRTDTELNLAVLRRHNPQILDLHHVAPYAVVYTFSPASSAWEKCGIEGSAFLVSLLPTATHASRFAVMVLNRRGLENFSVELQSKEEVEVADDYIILQGEIGGEPTVFGLWVFAEPAPASTSQQRVEMARKILECAEKVEAGRRLPMPADDEGYEGEVEAGPEDEGGAYAQGTGMGRQGSLTAMLEQQRHADDSWSVRSHSPLPHGTTHSSTQATLVQSSATSMFTASADTDFFLSARPQMTSSPAITVSTQESTTKTGGQKDVLLELFRKAGDGYRGSS